MAFKERKGRGWSKILPRRIFMLVPSCPLLAQCRKAAPPQGAAALCELLCHLQGHQDTNREGRVSLSTWLLPLFREKNPTTLDNFGGVSLESLFSEAWQ